MSLEARLDRRKSLRHFPLSIHQEDSLLGCSGLVGSSLILFSYTNRADLLDEQASRSEDGEKEKRQVRQHIVGGLKELLHMYISTSPHRRERDTICVTLGPIAVPERGGVDG